MGADGCARMEEIKEEKSACGRKVRHYNINFRAPVDIASCPPRTDNNNSCRRSHEIRILYALSLSNWKEGMGETS